MPKNWKTYKLGEIGKVQTGPFGSQLHQKDYVIGGTPLVTVKNLGLKKINRNSLDGVSDKDVARLKKYILRTGDIVFSRVGVNIDRSSLVTDDEDGWVFSSSTLMIRLNDTIVYPEFLIYSINTEKFKNYIRTVAVGATRPSLNTSILSNAEVQIPNLKEQTQIANILSAIDDKIENNLATNKTLEDMAMALYKHWFVDFGPFQDGEFVDSELGLIPKGWEVKKFNDLIDKTIDNRGKTPPLSKGKTDFLLLETYQLSRDSLFPNEIKENKAKYVSEEIYNNLKWFRKGHPQFMDILFATVGNGIPNWSLMYENDGVGIAQNVVAIRPKSNISSSFLRYSFESQLFLGQFDGYVITTAQPSIKLSDLNMIDMILPKQEIMDKWNRIVDGYVDQVYINYKENKSLTELRDTLLPKLISGEIRLKEFREEIETRL